MCGCSSGLRSRVKYYTVWCIAISSAVWRIDAAVHSACILSSCTGGPCMPATCCLAFKSTRLPNIYIHILFIAVGHVIARVMTQSPLKVFTGAFTAALRPTLVCAHCCKKVAYTNQAQQLAVPGWVVFVVYHTQHMPGAYSQQT
jgi:hypothetical protein